MVPGLSVVYVFARDRPIDRHRCLQPTKNRGANAFCRKGVNDTGGFPCQNRILSMQLLITIPEANGMTVLLSGFYIYPK